MKSSNHILAGIIWVMLAVFTSSVFAQPIPTGGSGPPPPPSSGGQQIQPVPKHLPILQKTDPKQKLRELQAAEDRKRTNRQVALKAEITKLVQKDIEIKKTKKVEICTSPKIFNVYPREVYPIDPIYIRGCGFGILKGTVTISPLNRQLEIDTWVDGGIVGKIPDITGFADPKAITLKVTTARGQTSDPLTNITLKPKIVLKILETTPILAQGGAYCTHHISSLYTIWHWSPMGHRGCQGIDTITEGRQLINNWVFYYLDFYKICLELREDAPSDLPEFMVPTQCSANEWVHPTQTIGSFIGRPAIPKIDISWGFGLHKAIAYSSAIYISGPANTDSY